MDNKESVLIAYAHNDKCVAVVPSDASAKLQDDAKFLLVKGMTDNQKAELVRIQEHIALARQRDEDCVPLSFSECEMLVGLVKSFEEQNKSWKQQCGRLIKLVDRVEKDIRKEISIYKVKTS
jgi:hypothetical protein